MPKKGILRLLILFALLGAWSLFSIATSKSTQNKTSGLTATSKFSAKNPTQDSYDLPLDAIDQAVPLINTKDANLQHRLQDELDSNPTLRRLIASKKMSLGLVDLSDVSRPKFAGINEHTMLYAASLPKIVVLLAVQEAIDQNELNETKAIRDDMNAMIRFSNNAATTRLIDLVGYQKLEAIVRHPKYRFYDEQNGGGLWVGKRYSKKGNTNREPLKQLSHAATAFQVCRFYYYLCYGKLINYERSKDMLDIMKNPGIKHKFVYALKSINPDAELYRKSGSWKNWHADSVLVWDADKRYIVVALIEDPNGEAIIRQLIKPIESILY